MKVKVKKEFELHSNNRAYKGDILNLISVNYDFKEGILLVVLERYNHIFTIFFDNTDEANEYLEFNYEELKETNYVWIREDEVNKRIEEACKKKDEQVDYWKSKFMKLVDKM